MSKRKPLDKEDARERRNRMLDRAADARLSLTDGVREMRAIAGMTQEDFARHRGVGARVVKALELGQGNPTMATLNRIGAFFGLEAAFVPVRKDSAVAQPPSIEPKAGTMRPWSDEEIARLASETAQRVIQGLKARLQPIDDGDPMPPAVQPRSGRRKPGID